MGERTEPFRPHEERHQPPTRPRRRRLESLRSIPRKTERRIKQAAAILTIPGIVLALIALAVASTYFLYQPTTLTVGVNGKVPIDQRVIAKAAEILASQKSSIRLRPRVFEDEKALASALQGGHINMAVLRANQLVDTQLQTVLILRRESAILLAPAVSKLKKITDLKTARIGVLDPEHAQAVLDPIFAYYNLPADKIERVPTAHDEIEPAFKSGKINALFVLGAANSKYVSEAVSAAAQANKDLNFIEIDEAKAISKRVPALDAVDIDQGAFGGRPPRPPQELSTLAIGVRMVTTSRLSLDIVADVVRQLVAIRQNLSAAFPGASAMEAPDTDDSNSMVIHPGVKSYLNADRVTLMDRYGDWFYLLLFAGSGLGSVIAATFGWFQRQRRQEVTANVRRIEGLLDDVHKARSERALDDIEQAANDVIRQALRHAARGDLGDTEILTLELAMSELRAQLRAARLSGPAQKRAAVR